MSGYAGPAALVCGDVVLPVQVELRSGFQPLDGRVHWHGRLAADPRVDELVRPGDTVVLRTETGEAQGRADDRDPWGRYRIRGTGRAPY